MLAISVQEAPPFVENCHLVMLPVNPLNVIVPALAPLQTVAAPDVVPPAETGLTVMVAEADATGAHTPLCIIARYEVVIVKLLYC